MKRDISTIVNGWCTLTILGKSDDYSQLSGFYQEGFSGGKNHLMVIDLETQETTEINEDKKTTESFGKNHLSNKY